MEVLWVAVREENPPRPLRDRMDPLILPDHMLIRQYRLPRPAIIYLADMLSNDLKRKTRRSSPLQVVTQIMAALRFFASGSFQMVVGGTLGVSQSSVSRVVRDVTNALCRRARQFIKFPATDAECIRSKQQFFEMDFQTCWGQLMGHILQSKYDNVQISYSCILVILDPLCFVICCF